MSIPVKDGYYPTLKWAPPPYLTPKIPFNPTFFKRSISLPCIGMCAQYISLIQSEFQPKAKMLVNWIRENKEKKNVGI